MKEILWKGNFPRCDIHYAQTGDSHEAPYDSPIRGGGSWANMCESAFQEFGVDEKSQLPMKRVRRKDGSG